MTVQRVVCDVCSAERREANHWFRVEQSEIGLLLLPWGFTSIEGSPGEGLASGPAWRTTEAKDLCGEQCLILAVQEFARRLKGTGICRS
jgi:hypothetical protein